MALKVGSYVIIANTTETEILSYTGSAGEFIRSWGVSARENVANEEAADLLLKVNTIIIDHGIIKDIDRVTEEFYRLIPPYPLDAADVVTITVQRKVAAGTNNVDYRAVLH